MTQPRTGSMPNWKSWSNTAVEHALPIALAALTVAGVAGYAAGRAYLEGWYAAAGISPLAFSWEIQYVVLRGLSSDVLWLWLGGLLTISFVIVLFGTTDVVFDWLRDRWIKKDQAKKPTTEMPSSSRKAYQRRLVVVFFLAYIPVAIALLWFVAAKLLTEIPGHKGQRDFLILHAAATCHFPPWVFSEPPELMASLGKEGEPILASYRWVEIQSPSLTGPAHGWLLQLQGSTLMLLTPTGADLIFFADNPFRVSNVATPQGIPSNCVGPVPAASRPTFRTNGS